MSRCRRACSRSRTRASSSASPRRRRTSRSTRWRIGSGRIQITLKPLAERGESVGDVIGRLRLALAKVDGITLYLQPVQDLTVENRVSRTQFQYSLEDPDEAELRAWAPK